MSSTPLELRRLAALARYRLQPAVPLDEPALTRLVKLAARLFAVPTALISFVGEGWQRWGGSYGLDALALAAVPGGDSSGAGGPGSGGPESGVSATHSLCALVTGSGELLVLTDMLQDPVYRHHPAASDLGVRFYAGVPLKTPEGYTIGTLCLIDQQPRPALDPAQRLTLGDLAAMIMDQLELRLTALAHEKRLNGTERHSGELRDALAQAETLQAIHELADPGQSMDELLLRAVARCSAVCDVDLGSLIAVHGERAFIFPAWHDPQNERVATLVSRGTRRTECEQIWTTALAGANEPVFLNDYESLPGAYLPMVQAGVRAQVLVFVGQRDEVRFVMALSRLHRDRPWRPRQRELIAAVALSIQNLSLQICQHRELITTNTQLQLALASAPLIVFRVDRGGILRAMRGSDGGPLNGDQRVGRPYELALADVPQMVRNVGRAMNGENVDDVVEIGERMFDVRYIHLPGASGELGGALGVGYDVTSRVRS